MLRRVIAAVAVCLPVEPGFAQDIGVGADQGYKMAYEAFCKADSTQVQNILQLLKLGQISDKAFTDARLESLVKCPRLVSGLPEGTLEAIYRVREVKRVFHLPGSVAMVDPLAPNAIPGSVHLFDNDMTILKWFIEQSRDLKRIASIIKAGADVNWRDRLGFPLVYFAAHRRNPQMLKLLVDAGADVDIQVPKTVWREDNNELVYADFVTTQQVPTRFGAWTVGSLKPEARNGAIWRSLQTRLGATQTLLAYVATTCNAYRSQECWEMINILLDKGVKPPRDFLHTFFRDNSFYIFPSFPEYAAGLDRLEKLGVSLNAPDAGGRTVLARLMQMPNNPETLKLLIARGAKLQAAAATQTSTTASIPGSPKVPLGKRTVTAEFNVRSMPSVAGTLIVVLKPGQVVQVEGSNAESTWSRVAVPGTSGGWALNSVLLKNSQ